MANPIDRRGRGYAVVEFAVAVTVFGVLVAVLLWRTRQYNAEMEREAVQLTVHVLRNALQSRLVGAGPAPRADELARLAEANPFDLLEQKPANYLGEYYSPDLNSLHRGNWVFDRRDKTLIYLLNSDESFSLNASRLLKFKVEFAHAQLTLGKTNGPAEVPKSLVIVQVSDPAAIDAN
jgi:type II secretory pathway pseudopilin PulG